MKHLALAACFAVFPALVQAQACEGPESCPQGTIWNPLTQTCGPLVMA